MLRRAMVVSLLCATCGCAQDGELTELVVLVRSDLRVPDQIDAVDITVIAPSGRVFSTRADRPSFATPVGISLRHAGGPLGPIEVAAVGRLREAGVVSVRVQTSFLEGESRVLVLHLSAACAGVLCATGETCAGGICRNAVIDPASLPRWTGTPPPEGDAGAPFDAGPPGVDAGPFDGGRVDAGRIDAGRPRDAGPDARVPDAGPCTCDPPLMCCGGECAPAGCDDSNPCTDDYCSPTGCMHASAVPGRTCSDGVYCNGVETCEAAVCTMRSAGCPTGTTCDEDTDRCQICADGMGMMGCTAPDTCTDALDITAGGTFAGTTCGADDTIDFTCGAGGMMAVPDLIFVIRAPGGMRSWNIDPSPGYIITDVRPDCTPGGMVCATGSLTANASGTVTIYFAVEQQAGGCGDFTMVVVPR